MAEIVDDRDAADLAAHGEAALHALELSERLERRRERDAEEVGDREHGERVEHVVAAGHADRHLAELLGAAPRHEAGAEAVGADVARAVVGLRRLAVGDVPLLHLRQDRLHARVVEAQRRSARRTARG